MASGDYAFIYDDLLNDRKHAQALAEVEARLTSLDVQGRVARLSLFRSARDLVESMVNQGVRTIVVVGNDRTLDKVMWFAPDLNVTIGYIPIAPPYSVAELLGIPVGPKACDVLSARLIETIDMGRFHDRYFLTEVHVNRTAAAVDIEGKYRISPANGGSITIRNLGSLDGQSSNAKDGLLEVIVTAEDPSGGSRFFRRKPSETRMLIRHGELISVDPMDVRVDGVLLNGFRFAIGIRPDTLRVITGRARRLNFAQESHRFLPGAVVPRVQ
jgi:diacylglycerol kinase family enzyme